MTWKVTSNLSKRTPIQVGRSLTVLVSINSKTNTKKRNEKPGKSFVVLLTFSTELKKMRHSGLVFRSFYFVSVYNNEDQKIFYTVIVESFDIGY